MKRKSILLSLFLVAHFFLFAQKITPLSSLGLAVHLPEGTYSVTVIDTNGCSVTAIKEVTSVPNCYRPMGIFSQNINQNSMIVTNAVTI